VKIEFGVTLYSRHEIKTLDFGLESIFDKTKKDISATLYLARHTDDLHDECAKLAEKYNLNFEIKGDNSIVDYNNELRHRAFDIKNADCAITIQPDAVFLKKDIFDSVVDEASQFFDSKCMVLVSTAHPDDNLPLAVTIHTKLGWEKIGCEDINFYPAAGSEWDHHRRYYLAHGFDPNDRKSYLEPMEGIITPPWIHRIHCKEFMHVGKSWHTPDSRLETPRGINYPLRLLHESLHWRWTDYYEEKWGGYLGQETFTSPFNNESNPLRIPWEDSSNPYPDSKFINLQGLIL